MRNGRNVDDLLWKGDPKAPPVQRFGIALFGVVFILIGIGSVSAALQREWELGSLIQIILFCGSSLVGLRLLWNAFRHE